MVHRFAFVAVYVVASPATPPGREGFNAALTTTSLRKLVESALPKEVVTKVQSAKSGRTSLTLGVSIQFTLI